MTGKNVDKLLDPMGETLRGIVRGRRGAGRLEVMVLWPEIEKALDAGVSVTAIWEALSKNELVSIKRRGFAKEVQARREGVRGAGTSAKPVSEVQAPLAAGAAPAKPVTPEPAEKTGEGPNRSWPPGEGPNRPWRMGRPRQAPDPNAVFKPRDPLADD